MNSPDTIPVSAPSSSPSRGPGAQSLLANFPLPFVLLALGLVGALVLTPRNVKAWNAAYALDIAMLVGVAVVMAVSLQLINGFSGQFSLGHAGFMAVGAYFSGYPSQVLSKDMTDPATILLFYVALFVSAGIGAAVLAGLFLAARASRRVHPSLPVILLVVLFGWIILDLSRGSRLADPPPWLVFSSLMRGLQKLFAAILAGGAPAATAVSRLLPAAAAGPVSFVVLLAGGGLCAAAVGFVVGLPALRLRGDYLAVATLGFAEIIRIAITLSPPLGGALGLRGIPGYTSFGWLYGTAAVTVVVVWRLAYSARGRAIQAVREDEIAAAAVGVSPTRQKVLAFVAGAFFAGVGGVLYAHYTGFITPTDFGLVRSIEFVVMVTLGGLGSISGAILAAMVLTLLPELLRFADRVMPEFVSRTGFQLSDWRMVIYSLLLIAVMLARPKGLLGGRELWPRRRCRATGPVDSPPRAGAA